MSTSNLIGKFMTATQNHVDYILEKGRDPIGLTPFFVNAIEPTTGSPLRIDTAEVSADKLLSNPSNQQVWFRTLAAMSHLTGKQKYLEAVDAVNRELFTNHTDKNGLIYWGGHVAFDFEKQEIIYNQNKEKVHEIKFCFPDYVLMWNLDPRSTKRYIEAVWNAHILDWSKLDFNRHGDYDAPLGDLWNNEYSGGDVFFWGKGLTFINTGSDLFYSAAMLSKLSGDKLPLTWSKRLVRRYIETRNSNIGISGYQFSQSENARCDSGSVRGDRAQYQLAHMLPEGHQVYEGMIFKPRAAAQRCLMYLGDALGEDGKEFTEWACEEIRAWGLHSYRMEDNSFTPMLTDGYSLEGIKLDRNGYFGPEGKIFTAMPANSDHFWMYAMAYRISEDEFLWSILRNIAKSIGIGDIGEDKTKKPVWNLQISRFDTRMIYGLLEIYKATNRADDFNMAANLANILLDKKYNDGCILSGSIVRLDDSFPLALLYLVAASSNDELPISAILR